MSSAFLSDRSLLDRLAADLQVDLASAALFDRNLVERIGGLFPHGQPVITHQTRILEINSGSGWWAVQVAKSYPGIKMIGLGMLPAHVAYAQGMSEAIGLGNAHFKLLSEVRAYRLLMPPLTCCTRFLIPVLQREEWLVFLTECKRVVKQGGTLSLVEAGLATTTSAALNRLLHLFGQVMVLRKHVVISNEDLSLVAQLAQRVEEGGWQQVRHKSCVMDFACGPWWPVNTELRLIHFENLLCPAILAAGSSIREELDTLLAAARTEMDQEDFSGTLTILAVSATKP